MTRRQRPARLSHGTRRQSVIVMGARQLCRVERAAPNVIICVAHMGYIGRKGMVIFIQELITIVVGGNQNEPRLFFRQRVLELRQLFIT